jgi:hypothetical protein
MYTESGNVLATNGELWDLNRSEDRTKLLLKNLCSVMYVCMSLSGLWQVTVNLRCSSSRMQNQRRSSRTLLPTFSELPLRQASTYIHTYILSYIHMYIKHTYACSIVAIVRISIRISMLIYLYTHWSSLSIYIYTYIHAYLSNIGNLRVVPHDWPTPAIR